MSERSRKRRTTTVGSCKLSLVVPLPLSLLWLACWISDVGGDGRRIQERVGERGLTALRPLHHRHCSSYLAFAFVRHVQPLHAGFSQMRGKQSLCSSSARFPPFDNAATFPGHGEWSVGLKAQPHMMKRRGEGCLLSKAAMEQHSTSALPHPSIPASSAFAEEITEWLRSENIPHTQVRQTHFADDTAQQKTLCRTIINCRPPGLKRSSLNLRPVNLSSSTFCLSSTQRCPLPGPSRRSIWPCARDRRARAAAPPPPRDPSQL